MLDGHGAFLGVHGFFAYLERKKYKLHVRVMLSKYRGYADVSRVQGNSSACRSAGGSYQRQ